MREVFSFLFESRATVGLVLLALLLLLCLISDSLRGKFKKGAVPILIVLGLGLGYYVIMGKSIFSIPGDINRFFSDPQIQEEPVRNYYRNPDERFGDQLQ